MTQQDKGQILMLCGAIHDVQEKSNEDYTKKQLKEIELKIEAIVNKYLPENTIIETKDY